MSLIKLAPFEPLNNKPSFQTAAAAAAAANAEH
jgi:hypothetical protein